jgi:DNA-directed RNA polymerase specialized sigma24 family protein
MAEENLLTQESFELLLRWLDIDREIAGQKYEKIRLRLIRVFTGRGCFEAEQLADETINRVTYKLPNLINSYIGEPALYFYGVANKLHLEWLRKEKKKKSIYLTTADHGKSASELEYDCLENCLDILPADHRSLIIEYYREEKRAKIEHRRRLAESFTITVGALQIKTCRIRAGLLKCLKNCIASKRIETFGEL